MIEAGAVEETSESKIVGKRRLSFTAMHSILLILSFAHSNYLEIKRVKISKTMSFLTSAS